MTVLGAFVEERRIILAADSLVTDEDGSTRQARKLWSLPHTPVAWGFSGDEDVGLPFGQRLADKRWSVSPKWADLRAYVVEILSELNREAAPEDRTEVLLAAWVEGSPRYLHIHKNDTPPTEGSKWYFIGKGGHAAVGELIRLSQAGEPLTWRLLSAAMTHAASVADMCGPPVRAIEVDHEGARILERFTEGE